MMKPQDLVSLLASFEAVRDSAALTEDQKQEIYKELLPQVPEPIMCRFSQATRQVVLDVISGAIKDDPRPKAKSKVTAKEGNKEPEHGEDREKELLQQPDGNTRGPRAKKAVVKQSAKKSGAAKRRS